MTKAFNKTDLKKQFFQEVISTGSLNVDNPFRNDINFLYGLMSYYESKQEYDKCVDLLDKIFHLKKSIR